MMRFIFLLGFVFSTGQALAQSQHECSEIVQDRARLNCFDAAFPALEAVISSTSEPFSVFRELVSSELRPERGARQVFLDNCWLFDVSFRGKSQNFINLEGLGRTIPLPPDRIHYSNSKFWVMLVNLRDVDLSISSRKAESTELVMHRGSEVRYIGVQQSLLGSVAVLGFKTAEDGLRVSSLQEQMVSALVGLPPNLNRWEALVTDPREIRYEFFKATDGVVDENYPNMSFRGEAFSRRSVDWNFSYMWPEDSAKIHSAFIELAKSCQS